MTTTLHDIKVQLTSVLDHEYAEAFAYLCDHGLSWDAKERPTYLPVTTAGWLQANSAKSEATIWLGLAIGNAQRDISSPDQGRGEIAKALAAGADPNDLALECWETIHRPCGLMFTMIDDAGLRFTPYQAAELLAIWLGADVPGAEEALTGLLARKQSSTLLAAIEKQATKLAAPKRKI